MLRTMGILAAVCIFTILLFLPASAGDTATVTVTPCSVAADVTDGSVGFGTMNYSPSSANPTKKNTVNISDTQTIKNTGNCTAELRLRSSDATGGTTPWDLVACSSVAMDAFGMQYELNNLGAFDGTDFPSNNDTTGVLASLVSNGAATVDLGICMPTGSTDSVPKSILITAVLTAQP